MTTLADASITIPQEGLTRKQRKSLKKYADVDLNDLTDTIWSSWTRKIPRPRIWLLPALLIVIVGSVIGVLFATPDMSAVYYLTTQTNEHVKTFWDSSVPTFWRHAFRDNSIGLAAGLFIVFVSTNRYKVLKPLTKWDKWEINFHIFRLHPISNPKDDRPFSIAQMIGSFIMMFPYASFGWFLSEGIILLVTHVGFIQHGLEHIFGGVMPLLKQHTSAHGAAILDRMHDSMVDKWPGKVTGLMMAFFFGRRPIKGTMGDLQLWLVQQRYLRNAHADRPEQSAPWYYLPNWRATYNDVRTTGAAAIENHGAKVVWTMRFAMIMSLALAAYGWYVLMYIAHK